MNRIPEWTRALTIGVGAAMLLGGAVLADSPPAWYDIEPLLPFAGTERCPAYSNATGINKLGHTVGIAEVGEDVFDQGGNWIRCRFLLYGVMWRDGETVDLGYLEPEDWHFANGKGINDHDQVVGQSMGTIPGRAGGFGMPFLWTEGEGMINPAAEAGMDDPMGQAWGINNAGQVALMAGPGYRAHVWDPVDGIRPIGFPDDPGGNWGSDAWEINNDGLVCGAARRTSDNLAFLHAFRYDYWTDTITDLHDLYYRHSGAYGLNDRGDIGGWTVSYTERVFARLWKSEGEAILLPLGDDDPELAFAAQIEHINNHGIMVGSTLGSILPRRMLGWVAFEAPGRLPDRLPDLPFDGRPIGSVNDSATIVIKPAPRPGPRSIRKIALLDLLSDEDRAAWDRLHPMEINDAGQIVGTGSHNGLARGFLMTPRFSVKIVLEEATSTELTVTAPASAEASRLATARIPDADAVISAIRKPDGTLPVGRFSPVLARHGRGPTGEIVTSASDSTLPLDPRSAWKDCAPEDRGCIYGVDTPDDLVTEDPETGETPPPTIPDALGGSGPKLETNR